MTKDILELELELDYLFILFSFGNFSDRLSIHRYTTINRVCFSYFVSAKIARNINYL